MSLAIRFEQLLADGIVTDYAELSRLSHVSRAQISHIMNLRLLAPDIQEAILFSPRVQQGRDRVRLRELEKIALEHDWVEQRRGWGELAN